MRKIVFKTLLPILLVNCSNIRCRGKINFDNPDSLRKYSYFIIGYSSKYPNNAQGGTCFFIRSRGHLFLITNYHIWTGVDVFHQTRMLPEYDSVYFRGYDTGTSKPHWIALSVLEDRLKSQLISFLNNPDLQVALLPADLSYLKINSIEEYIDESPADMSNIDSAICFGFPFDADKRTFNPDTVQSHQFTGFIEKSVRDPYYKNIDSLNIVLQPKSAHGYSGSPVFFIISKNGRRYATFGGIAFGNDSINNLTYIVKKEEVCKQITQLITLFNR